VVPDLPVKPRVTDPDRRRWEDERVVTKPLAVRLLTEFRWLDPGADATHEVSDMSGWWREPALLAGLGPALAALFPEAEPTVVVAPEAAGFLLGPLVAHALGVGFVEAHKDGRGRVAARMLRRTTAPDYRGRSITLSVQARLLSATDRVLVVDDWVATGAQIAALRSLVHAAGAQYLGAAVIVDACPRPVAVDLGVRSLLTHHDLEFARRQPARRKPVHPRRPEPPYADGRR